ncbi:MAG: HAMP domain-containing histidine kinase [Rhizobiaceae bacterium]|nr:HAMP domain-containing histidine kinase [Rhizobiaceae bacterium]MCV0407071.1 HAMP domain-containing histidine kinase [Rhizobiaceae bacterium]
MALESFQQADKIIVDRRKPHRNTDVARAVRAMRERLANKSENPAFDRELLKLHAHAMASAATAIPILVLVVTAAGMTAGMDSSVIAWALVTVALYLALAWYARAIDGREAAELDVRRTRLTFLAGHFATGIGWAIFAALGCGACQVEQFPVVKAVVLLVAMAATAIIASSLGRTLFVTFGLPIAVYAWGAWASGEPVQAILAGLLIGSLPFFSFVAGHLERSALSYLTFRTEKDALIVELETAKSMSDEARRRAEEANLAKSRFLASMSHELRTPLNAILGFSEVMAKQVLGPIENETYRDYARDIHDSGEHLLNLINEILDLSRIEAGRYQLNEEPVTIAYTIEECCHLVELRARTKDIRVIQNFQPGLPRLFADERSIRQIGLNLLSNAIKFTPSGGEVRVTVGWTAGGGQYISVRDNGPGIPPEEIPIVLAAFGQGSIAIKSAEQGTGLGLPIVQGLVELHGGTFDLKSKLREGTEAIATFPASRVMEELPAIPTAPARAAAGGRR